MKRNMREIETEVTRRVTGSLDLAQSLASMRSYLSAWMPIDEVSLFRIDRDTMGLYQIIRVDESGAKGTMDELFHVIDKKEKVIKDEPSSWESEGGGIILRKEIKDEYISERLVEMGISPSSDLIVLFDLELGAGLIALSYKGDAYTEEHVELFTRLKDSFKVALSNALEYISLKRVRDDLVSSNEIFRGATIRLTGEQDIGKAFHETLLYLRSWLPLDRIVLATMMPETSEQRILLRVSKDGFISELDEIMVFETGVPAVELQRRLMEDFPDVFVGEIDDERFSPPMPQEEREARLKDLGINPEAKMVVLGVKAAQAAVVFITEDPSLFEPRHMAMLQTLKEPFVLALHNAIKFYEMKENQRRLEEENLALQREIQRDVGDRVIGMSGGLRQVMGMVGQVAVTSSPVLLFGETGTGKEVIATAVHRLSPRSDGPFISMNCGAMADTLIDSELFGHERGAFTGAAERKRGRFERANGGTLFLDEVGELPASAQVKLLRVLQEKEFERVGGSQTIRVDVRVIAATNRDLPAMVKDGRFREDLWFRLNVFPVEIPPVRERKEDIPSLVHYFMETKGRQLNLTFKPSLHPAELDRLVSYDWPGNVRELQNAVERALIISRGEPLRFPHLQLASDVGSYVPAYVAQEKAVEEIPTFDEAVRRYLLNILAYTGGKIAGSKGAAEVARLKPSTLRSKIKKHGITKQDIFLTAVNNGVSSGVLPPVRHGA